MTVTVIERKFVISIRKELLNKYDEVNSILVHVLIRSFSRLFQLGRGTVSAAYDRSVTQVTFSSLLFRP